MISYYIHLFPLLPFIPHLHYLKDGFATHMDRKRKFKPNKYNFITNPLPIHRYTEKFFKNEIKQTAGAATTKPKRDFEDVKNVSNVINQTSMHVLKDMLICI